MAQKSSIETLPQALFDEVNRCLVVEKMTIEQIVAHLATLGAKLSPSAVGRHKLKIDEVTKRLQESRIIAEAVGRELGDAPDDKMAALAVEMLQEHIMRLTMRSEDGVMVQLSSKEARELSDAMYRLAAGRKLDAERIFKVRKEMADQSAKIVDEETKKEPGMSAETVDNIKRRILGLTR